MEVKRELLNLNRKLYYKLDDAGMVCKYHPNKLNILVVGDCKGNLYFFDTLNTKIKNKGKNKLNNLSLKTKVNIHEYIIYDLDITDDGSKLIMGTSGQISCLFDIEKEKIIKIFDEHQNSVKVVNFNKKNSNCFLSGGRDGKLLLYDYRENDSFKKILVHDAKNERITGADFFEDDRLITSSQTNSFDCIIWDLRRLSNIKLNKKKNFKEKSKIMSFNSKSYLHNHLKSLRLQLSNVTDCNNFSYKSLMRDFFIFKKNFKDEIFEVENKLKGITGFLMKEIDLKLITSDVNNDIFLYNISSLGYSKPLKLDGFWSPSSNIRMTANNNCDKIAIGGAQNIFLWNLNKKKSICNIYERAHELEINCLDFAISPLNNLASVSDDSFCYIWEIPILK